MSRFCALFFFVTMCLSSLLLTEADRRRTPATTPFSCSEQALFGSFHAEDCLFGSTTSVFHVPEDDELLEVVKEAKATSTKAVPPQESGKPSAMAFAAPKPAFVDKERP